MTGGYDEKYSSQCPVHDDQRASLSLARGDDGTALIKCHAGCPTPAILHALGLTSTDLFSSNSVYVYTDEDGRPLFRKIRRGRKSFHFERRTGEAWITGLSEEIPRVPYQLPRLQAAVKAGRPIWFVEGEKDVHTLQEHGQEATTTGGSGSWDPDRHSDYFEGADVRIVADNDPAGYGLALQVYRSLVEIARSVQVLAVSTDGPGTDITDHFIASRELEDLRPLTEADLKALVLEVPSGPSKETKQAGTEPSEPPDPACRFLTRATETERPERVRWLWKGYVPLGELTVLAGKAKVGKGLMMADLAARLTTRGVQGDLQGESWSAVIASSEDDFESVVKPRLKAAGADLGRIFKANPFPLTSDDLAKFEDELRGQGVRLLVVDQLLDHLPPDTDVWKDHDVRLVLLPLVKLARRLDLALVAVLHKKKGSAKGLDQVADSPAFTAMPRSVLEVAGGQGGTRELRQMASNLGAKAPPVRFRVETERVDGVDIPRIRWLDADSAAHGTSNPTRRPARPRRRTASRLGEARAFLHQALAQGPRPAAEISEKARKQGISERTLERAQKELGVQREKTSFAGGWLWKLGGDAGAA